MLRVSARVLVGTLLDTLLSSGCVSSALLPRMATAERARSSPYRPQAPQNSHAIHKACNTVILRTMSDQSISRVLQLPPALLALLFQHVASGPGGLASAIALSQTCKALHSLSEGPDVTYRNLVLSAPISSPLHAVWLWLARTRSRIAGLSLELRLLGDEATDDVEQLPDWMQSLQSYLASLVSSSELN
jgi:hypothetical protein